MKNDILCGQTLGKILKFGHPKQEPNKVNVLFVFVLGIISNSPRLKN